MSWPLSQDYNEAIQDPRNSFGDAELKTGEAVANALGIPLPRSGNFADVYEVRCPAGSRWAVKCFTREVPGLRERYHEISKYLRQTNLPFMVDFQYLEQGIRVRGGWFPVLKMQWVEGYVLNEFVRDNLDKKPILQALGQIWLRMARRLREANLAHCDLQHGNVLFVPGSSTNSLAVKLIDYDGMCVPALAGTKSGEVGHPAFQHPERLKTGAYNSEVDRFSLLAIAAGLRCLSAGGRSLWERYDNGDNLLFRQADLQAPTQSSLFQELLAIRDPQAQGLVKELYRACQGSLNAVPLLADVVPAEKAASASRSRLSSTTQQGPDWDFGDEEPIAKKRKPAGKMPRWAWGAIGGAAALLLVGVGLGVGLGLRPGSEKQDKAPVAQRKPEAVAPKPPAPTPEDAPRTRDRKDNAEVRPPTPDAGNVGAAPPPPPPSPSPPPPPPPAAQVRTVYLADLPTARVAALSFAKRDGSKVNNSVSPNNVFLHPSDNGAAQAVYSLGKKYSRFTATVGIRDGANGGRGSGTPLTFRVLGDDKELWKSAPIQRCGETRDCQVSVAGVEQLEIRVDCPGAAFCAHAIWVEPSLEADNSSPPSRNIVVKPPPKPTPRPGRRARNRIPAPGENQLADARKQIKVMYRDDYKDKSKRGLAARLYEESTRQGDLAVRYALLTESREFATQSGDFAAALRAVTRLCEQFADDPLEWKCRTVEEALSSVTSKPEYRGLVQKVLLLVDRALIDEQYELAGRLLKVARAAAEKADMSAILKKAVDHSAKQLDAARTAYEAVKPAAAKLEGNPQDAEASLALGMFRCLTRDDWEGGLPLLEHGGDAALRELARKDLAAPQDAAARAALGDAWWERASKATGKEKTAYLRRAYYWYQDALAELDRKEQSRVKQQLAKVRMQLPELARPFADLDYSGPTVNRKLGILHMGPHQVVATRRLFRGPIDVRVTAALPKGHIRISYLNGGEITLDPENNNFKVRVYYPFGSDPEERGFPVTNSFGRLLPDPLQEIRMQVTANGWNGWVNNQGVGGQGGTNIGAIDYPPSPVRVWSDDGEIDIKSIVVKPAR